MADVANPIRHLNVNTNTNCSTELVAGITGMKIYLLSASLIAEGAVTVTFEDGNGTDRIGPMSLAANGGIVLPESSQGWTRTGSGQALNLRLNGNVRVGGSIMYRACPDHFDGN